MKCFYRYGIVLFMFLFILGSTSFGYQSPHYVKVAHEITANTAKKLEEQKKLYLVGTGGGMMGDIRMMAMSFHFYQEVDLKIARELIVYAVREYLSDINNNKEIRAYLRNYPFTAKNVEIRIFISGPDRRKLPQEKIYYISAINGICDYYVRSSENSRQAICEETYEEALVKIDFCQ